MNWVPLDIHTPQEIALLNGCFPSLVKPSNMSTRRLDMAGIGQLASPLQSCWISSHVLQAALDQGMIDTPIEPISTIKQLCRELFPGKKTDLLEVNSPTTYMQIFENAVEIENIGTKECMSEKNLPSPVHFSQALLEEVKRGWDKRWNTCHGPDWGCRKPMRVRKKIEEELIKPVALFSVTETKTDCQTKAESEEVHLPLHNPDPHVLDLWCEKDMCIGGAALSDMQETTTTTTAENWDSGCIHRGWRGCFVFNFWVHWTTIEETKNRSRRHLKRKRHTADINNRRCTNQKSPPLFHGHKKSKKGSHYHWMLENQVLLRKQFG